MLVAAEGPPASYGDATLTLMHPHQHPHQHQPTPGKPRSLRLCGVLLYLAARHPRFPAKTNNDQHHVKQLLYPSFLRVVGSNDEFSAAVGSLFRLQGWESVTVNILFAEGASRGLIYTTLARQVRGRGSGSG